MKRAAIALLLMLAACGGAPTANNDSGSSAPANLTDNVPRPAESPLPEANLSGAGPTAPAPEPRPAPQLAPGPDGSNAPHRFVVCPGNPRCPPAGNRPKGR